MFTSPKEGGPAARTLSLTQVTTDDPLRQRLLEHLQNLRSVLPIITVTVMALHRQDAELDKEIARVLDQHASEPLDAEIEAIEALLASVEAPCRLDLAA